MPAPVRIEQLAWTDWRFEAIGRRLYPNLDPVDARDLAHMKFNKVVAHCTRHQVYALRAIELDGIGGTGFARALVECELGEHVDAENVRVKGTSGRIEWIDSKKKNGSKGGKAKASRKRDGESVAKASKRVANASERERTAGESYPPSPSLSPDPSLFQSPPPAEEKQAAPAAPRCSPAFARFRALFDALYGERNEGVEPSWDKKHCIMANKLLAAHGEEEVCRRTEIMFRHAPDWIARGGVDIGTLVSQWDKLARASPTNGRRTAQERLAIANALDGGKSELFS